MAVESGAGEGSGHPDAASTRRPAPTSGRAMHAWGADVVVKVALPTAEEIGRLRSGQVLIGHLAPLTSAGDQPGAGGGGGDQLRDGGDPADHPRAGDGRALLAGERGRLRRHPARRARGRSLLPDDDHRRGHRRAGEGDGARRRRRRPPGDRDRQAARRGGHRVRHPPRRLGADREPRRPAAGARLHPRCRGGGRLRPAADRGGERAGARGAGGGGQAPGRDHHHGADTRPAARRS